MDWRWLLSSALRFWVTVGVLIALGAVLRLNWARLPQWARWASSTVVGVLYVWFVVAELLNLVSDLCNAPRREVVSMLVILAGTLTILVVVYLKLVTEHVQQLRRMTEALKRRIAADHPNDDVIVATDGSVTFRPRLR